MARRRLSSETSRWSFLERSWNTHSPLFYKKTAETEATSLAAMAASQKIPGKEFEKQDKHSLSGFANWSQRDHADTWMLFPKNIGPQLSIAEVAVTNGELYTVLTNKAAHGKRGALIAMGEGTTVCESTPILATIPVEKRALVPEVTLDMSESMNAMGKQAFPNAILVLARFPVQRLVSEAVQDIRIEMRREAIKEENSQIKQAQQEKKPSRPQTFENGETKKPLLARSR